MARAAERLPESKPGCREHVLAEHKCNQRVGKALKGCWRTGTLLEDDAGQLEAYYQVQPSCERLCGSTVLCMHMLMHQS